MSVVKPVPLSVMIFWGTPNLCVMLEMNLIIVSASTFITVLAPIHFVNLSVVTRRNLKLPGIVVRGPTLSSPHIENGHIKRCCFVGGGLYVRLLCELLTTDTLADDQFSVAGGVRLEESMPTNVRGAA